MKNFINGMLDGMRYGAIATSPMWLYLYCFFFNKAFIQ